MMKSITFLVLFAVLLTVAEQSKLPQCVVKPTSNPCNADGRCDENFHQCLDIKGTKGCYPTCAGFIGKACPNGLSCCFSYPNGVYKPTSPPGTADMSGFCF